MLTERRHAGRVTDALPGRGGVALVTAPAAAGLIVTLGGFIFYNTNVLNEK